MSAVRALLHEADRMRAGLITWRRDGDHWYCFASGAGVPHVARGTTGIAALAELVAFLRALG